MNLTSYPFCQARDIHTAFNALKRKVNGFG